MSTVWHRFPARDFHALKAALGALGQADALLVSDGERARLATLLATLDTGFAAKQDAGLDVAELILALEFALATGIGEHGDQLRNVLHRLRAHAAKSGGIA